MAHVSSPRVVVNNRHRPKAGTGGAQRLERHVVMSSQSHSVCQFHIPHSLPALVQSLADIAISQIPWGLAEALGWG